MRWWQQTQKDSDEWYVMELLLFVILVFNVRMQER